jgi:hypothetical protein
MSLNSPSKFVAVLCAGLTAAPLLFGFNLFSRHVSVVVDSVSTKAYQERQANRGPDDIETFQIMQGQFFGGAIKDRSLERVSFQNVVDTLAKSLAKRNYLPHYDMKGGDLLLIVHHGVTTVEEDWNDLMGITSLDQEADTSGDSGFDDQSGASTSTSDYNTFSSNNHSAQNNANLLGFNRQLRKNNLTPSEEYELRSDLEEERYFIIVMAYDLPKLRETGKAEILWSTRFSMRSPGTNFEEAHIALSRAGVPYFGTHLDKLERETASFGNTEVEIGELKVIESDVNTAPEKAPRQKPR